MFKLTVHIRVRTINFKHHLRGIKNLHYVIASSGITRPLVAALVRIMVPPKIFLAYVTAISLSTVWYDRKTFTLVSAWYTYNFFQLKVGTLPNTSLPFFLFLHGMLAASSRVNGSVGRSSPFSDDDSIPLGEYYAGRSVCDVPLWNK